MRLEGSQNFERRGEYAHRAIMTSKEKTLGTRADAAYFIVVEEGFGLVVGRIDLADFEEIERFPLQFVSKVLPLTGLDI